MLPPFRGRTVAWTAFLVQTTLTNADWRAYTQAWTRRVSSNHRALRIGRVLLGVVLGTGVAWTFLAIGQSFHPEEFIAGLILATVALALRMYFLRRNAMPDPDGIVRGPVTFVYRLYCVYDRRYQVDQCGAYGTDAAANSRTDRAEDARRARLILLLAEGHTWDEVSERIECSRGFVASWNKRFVEQRIAGLYSRHLGQVASVLTRTSKRGSWRRRAVRRAMGRRTGARASALTWTSAT